MPVDHESALLAAVLLALRAQAGEDVSAATDRLAQLAGQGEERNGEEEPAEFGEWDPAKHPHGQHGQWARKGEGGAGYPERLAQWQARQDSRDQREQALVALEDRASESEPIDVNDVASGLVNDAEHPLVFPAEDRKKWGADTRKLLASVLRVARKYIGEVQALADQAGASKEVADVLAPPWARVQEAGFDVMKLSRKIESAPDPDSEQFDQEAQEKDGKAFARAIGKLSAAQSDFYEVAHEQITSKVNPILYGRLTEDADSDPEPEEESDDEDDDSAD